MDKIFTYKYQNNIFLVEVTYKKMKNIRYRFQDNKFIVSCPKRTLLSTIENGIKKYGPNLIKRGYKPVAFTNEYIYIFGVKINLAGVSKIHFSNGKDIEFRDKEDLHKKLKVLLKDAIEARQRFYEYQMGINPPYKVFVKDVKTYFGINSKQKQSITYAFKLIHYDFKIIDAIIVHELAHDKVRNHSKKFYDVVYQYYPSYKEDLKKLKRGIFK